MRVMAHEPEELLIMMLAALIIATSPSAQAGGYVPTPVFGADRQARFAEGLAAAPARSFYVGGYASADDSGPFVVHFYAVDDPATARQEGNPYAAIPWARRTSEADPTMKAQWADGRRCPGLYGALGEFQELSAPSLWIGVEKGPR